MRGKCKKNKKKPVKSKSPVTADDATMQCLKSICKQSGYEIVRNPFKEALEANQTTEPAVSSDTVTHTEQPIPYTGCRGPPITEAQINASMRELFATMDTAQQKIGQDKVGQLTRAYFEDFLEGRNSGKIPSGCLNAVTGVLDRDLLIRAVIKSYKEDPAEYNSAYLSVWFPREMGHMFEESSDPFTEYRSEFEGTFSKSELDLFVVVWHEYLILQSKIKTIQNNRLLAERNSNMELSVLLVLDGVTSLPDIAKYDELYSTIVFGQPSHWNDELECYFEMVVEFACALEDCKHMIEEVLNLDWEELFEDKNFEDVIDFIASFLIEHDIHNHFMLENERAATIQLYNRYFSLKGRGLFDTVARINAFIQSFALYTIEKCQFQQVEMPKGGATVMKATPTRSNTHLLDPMLDMNEDQMWEFSIYGKNSAWMNDYLQQQKKRLQGSWPSASYRYTPGIHKLKDRTVQTKNGLFDIQMVPGAIVTVCEEIQLCCGSGVRYSKLAADQNNELENVQGVTGKPLTVMVGTKLVLLGRVPNRDLGEFTLNKWAYTKQSKKWLGDKWASGVMYCAVQMNKAMNQRRFQYQIPYAGWALIMLPVEYVWPHPEHMEEWLLIDHFKGNERFRFEHSTGIPVPFATAEGSPHSGIRSCKDSTVIQDSWDPKTNGYCCWEDVLSKFKTFMPNVEELIRHIRGQLLFIDPYKLSKTNPHSFVGPARAHDGLTDNDGNFSWKGPYHWTDKYRTKDFHVQGYCPTTNRWLWEDYFDVLPDSKCRCAGHADSKRKGRQQEQPDVKHHYMPVVIIAVFYRYKKLQCVVKPLYDLNRYMRYRRHYLTVLTPTTENKTGEPTPFTQTLCVPNIWEDDTLSEEQKKAATTGIFETDYDVNSYSKDYMSPTAVFPERLQTDDQQQSAMVKEIKLIQPSNKKKTMSWYYFYHEELEFEGLLDSEDGKEHVIFDNFLPGKRGELSHGKYFSKRECHNRAYSQLDGENYHRLLNVDLTDLIPVSQVVQLLRERRQQVFEADKAADDLIEQASSPTGSESGNKSRKSRRSRGKTWTCIGCHTGIPFKDNLPHMMECLNLHFDIRACIRHDIDTTDVRFNQIKDPADVCRMLSKELNNTTRIYTFMVAALQKHERTESTKLVTTEPDAKITQAEHYLQVCGLLSVVLDKFEKSEYLQVWKSNQSEATEQPARDMYDWEDQQDLEDLQDLNRDLTLFVDNLQSEKDELKSKLKKEQDEKDDMKSKLLEMQQQMQKQTEELNRLMAIFS